MEPQTTIRALCVRCGHFKLEGVGICKTCGFRPRSLDDRIRSLYFEPRFSSNGIVALSPIEINAASCNIKSGTSVALDPDRLSKVAAEYKRAMRRLAFQLVLVLVPMLVILAFLYARVLLT